MQNPPKRWEIFTSKKGCEGVYGFPRIFWWSCRKNDGGHGDGGGVEVPVERMRVESVLPKMKKKKRNKREVREGAGQRNEKMEWLWCG